MRRNNSSSNKLAAAEQGQKQQHKMPKPQPWLVLLSQRRVALQPLSVEAERRELAVQPFPSLGRAGCNDCIVRGLLGCSSRDE